MHLLWLSPLMRNYGGALVLAAALLGTGLHPGFGTEALAHAANVSELTHIPSQKPIVGGEPTEAGEFEPVVAILAHEGLCTGTIVSPTIVLTAAHCLADVQIGQEVAVFWGPEIDQSRRVTAVGWGVHPDFCADCDEDIFDFGYVEVAGEFVASDFIAPITDQDEWDDAMRKGREVILVGYGEDPDVTSLDKGLGTKRMVTTKISRFSDLGLEFYAGGDDRDSCQGDSGGPAFVRAEDGTLRLAGITSRGSNPCGKGGYYGAPYPALCWLADETGVDLRPDGCGACDCLDTSPPPEDGGCSLARGDIGERSGTPLLLGLGLALALGRRRR
jgi:hypothetical protein